MLVKKHLLIAAILSFTLAGCAAPKNTLFSVGVSEAKARETLGSDSNKLSILDIAYFDRNESTLYSTVNKIGQLKLNRVDIRLLEMKNKKLYFWLQCRKNRSCDSDQFKDCEYISAPSDSYDYDKMAYLDTTLRKRGYPIAFVILSEDPSIGKTIEVEYFSECDKIASDMESIYKNYNAKK